MYQRARAHISTCLIFMRTVGKVQVEPVFSKLLKHKENESLAPLKLTEKDLETLLDHKARVALSRFEEARDSACLITYPVALELPPALRLPSAAPVE